MGRTFREVVAVDETKARIKGKFYNLWAVKDVQIHRILGV